MTTVCTCGARQDSTTLTRRERMALALLRRGFCNKEIAAELGVTEGTVKIHLHNAYGKLGVGSRLEAVLRLADLGIA